MRSSGNSESTFKNRRPEFLEELNNTEYIFVYTSLRENRDLPIPTWHEWYLLEKKEEVITELLWQDQAAQNLLEVPPCLTTGFNLIRGKDEHDENINIYLERFRKQHWARIVTVLTNAAGEVLKGAIAKFNNPETLVS
ncbi:hypothetical protein EYZ11_012929 [Aspergillus tanneri]|uniref:Uncharacterized protein n=1 Tax=Aspergillus tanneri TaxID=1220188 RepID=A0A4S3IZ01_9EURO|nr:hypothetical protein EYZ11_012929 [Aspergillus tanneri]